MENKSEARSSITFGTPTKGGAFKYYLKEGDEENEIKKAILLYKVFLRVKSAEELI